MLSKVFYARELVTRATTMCGLRHHRVIDLLDNHFRCRVLQSEYLNQSVGRNAVNASLPVYSDIDQENAAVLLYEAIYT